MSTTPEPLPVEGDELAERIDALQRSIEWRRAALLAQTLRKLNAWRDRTRSDADQRITRLEAAQAAEQDELHMLEARQRLSRMLRQAHTAAAAESVEAGNWIARALDDGRVADVIELRSTGR